MKQFLLRSLIAGALVTSGLAMALFLLPEKLTIASGEPQPRAVPTPPPPDRTDEVLDEVEVMRTALRAFAEHLDEAGRQRDALAQQIVVLGRNKALDPRLSGLERRMDDWGIRLTKAINMVAVQKRAPVKVIPPPKPEVTVKPEPRPKAETEPKPKAETPKKRPSLAAMLAKRKKRDVRDKRARYRLMKGFCRVGFDGSSTVHNFTAKADVVRGAFFLHFNKLDDKPAGEISLDVNSLASGNGDRDEEIRSHLSEGGHPLVRCELLGFDAPTHAGKGVLKAKARVRFTIHGQSRELVAPVTIEFTRARILHISGEVKLKMSAFGIHPKAKFGLISVENELTAWWDLNAEVDRGTS